jgi:hypothetical protein
LKGRKESKNVGCKEVEELYSLLVLKDSLPVIEKTYLKTSK